MSNPQSSNFNTFEHFKRFIWNFILIETDTEAKAASIHSGSGSNQGGVDGGQQPLTQEPHLLQSMLSMGGEEPPIAEGIYL